MASYQGEWVVTSDGHRAQIIRQRSSGLVDVRYDDHNLGVARYVDAGTLRRVTRNTSGYDTSNSSGCETAPMCQTGESTTDVGSLTDDSTAAVRPGSNANSQKLYRSRPHQASAAHLPGDTKTIMVRCFGTLFCNQDCCCLNYK